MSTMEQRILEEMVYGRVRGTVNLCQLVIIEQELEETIERAMGPGEEAKPGPAGVGADAGPGEGCGASGAAVPDSTPCALAREYVQRAWERLAREWGALREDLARAERAWCVQGAEGEGDAP